MEDLISRKGAMRALWHNLFVYQDSMEEKFQNTPGLDVGDWFIYRNYAQDMSDLDRCAILKLPSVSVNEKSGKWIKTLAHYKDEVTEFDYYKIRCSECGNRPQKAWCLTPYCPWCGARLKEAEE